MRAWGVQRIHRGAVRQGVTLAALLVAMLALVTPDIGHATEKKKSRRPSKSGDNSGQVYRWVDDQGVVHFGDQVPAEYAPIDRQVLNQYGIPLRTEQGAMTEEELEAERKAAAEKKAALAAARRDEVLLSTYLSVEEIEALRNRRIELIDGQISVTSTYLQSLQDASSSCRRRPAPSSPTARTRTRRPSTRSLPRSSPTPWTRSRSTRRPCRTPAPARAGWSWPSTRTSPASRN